MKSLLRTAVLVLFAFTATAVLAQQSLNNDAVLKMHAAGLSDDIIASSISAQPGSYTTSADDLIALKKAGLGDKVIGAMIAKNSGIPAAGAPESMLPAGVDEIGVYYKGSAGKWVAFDPEIINFKSGGFLKTLATDGIVKPDMNGHVPGKTAKLALTRPVEILIYAPDGTSPEEYQLLKLRVNSNNREFRSVTGGVIHSSTGAKRDDVAFQATKIGTRLYEFTMANTFEPGEYGILPPGAVSTVNAASAGKLYTFHLVE